VLYFIIKLQDTSKAYSSFFSLTILGRKRVEGEKATREEKEVDIHTCKKLKLR